MNIVVLDGGTTNPGDLSWAPLERLGQVTVYSQTPQPLVVERLATAQAALLNRAALGREEFAQLPQLRYVGTLATGYNTISTGQRMAALGLALGMEVLLCSRTQKAAPAGCRWVDVETLFRESDVVSLHCPLNGETRGLVGRRLLALLKPTALLINTARGGLVDESALAEALNQGKLAGAGLDVLTQEPPPPSCPLLTARNCVITPHVAWAAQEVRARLIDEVAENLRCFLAGHPRNVVS